MEDDGEPEAKLAQDFHSKAQVTKELSPEHEDLNNEVPLSNFDFNEVCPLWFM